MPIRSQIILIMGQIESEHLELFVLECGKIAEYDLFTLYRLQILTIQHQHGQNVCDHKISDEFDYGSNRTRTVRVICP